MGILALLWEHWPFVDTCTRHSYTLISTICVLLLLCLRFCHHPPHPHASRTHPYIYAGPILMNYLKNLSKTGKNQLLSTCQVSCTTLIDELVQYQGKASLFKLNFQNGVS